MDNQLYNGTYATLSIYSTILSERELRKLIPVEPDETIQKGTPRSGKKPGNVHKHSMLDFKSRLEPSASPDAHLADLMDLVRPAKQQIRAFADEARTADPDARMHVYVRLIVGAKSWMFGFDLDASSLQDILDLGAGFGIEVDVEEDEDDDDAD